MGRGRHPRQRARRARAAPLEGRAEAAPHPRRVHPLALRAEDAGVRLFACAARPPRHGSGAAVATRRRLAGRRRRRGRGPPCRPTARAPDGSTCHEPLFLVCTNGRHDQCCANLGRPLVRALRDSPWAEPGVGVLAHRRRSIRRQPRGAPGQPLLRSGRPGLGARAARRVSTRGGSTSPGSAGARRSRSPSRRSSTSCGASSASTPSTAW